MTLFGNRDFDRPRNEAARETARSDGAVLALAVPASAPTAAAGEARRVLLRLQGGEDLVIGIADSRDSGIRLARETMRLIDDAEARGEWPELDERYIRPGSIVSIDVQRVA